MSNEHTLKLVESLFRVVKAVIAANVGQIHIKTHGLRRNIIKVHVCVCKGGLPKTFDTIQYIARIH